MLLVSSVGYCAPYNNWGNTDTNVLLDRELTYDLIYVGYARGGASSMVSTASSITTAGLGYSVLTKVAADGTAAQNTIGLANGVKGQLLKIVLTTKGTNNFVIDKSCIAGGTTTTGWSTLTFTASGAWVVLLYIDDTVGWVVTDTKVSGLTVA
jgi:hypothetical protein